MTDTNISALLFTKQRFFRRSTNSQILPKSISKNLQEYGNDQIIMFDKVIFNKIVQLIR